MNALLIPALKRLILTSLEEDGASLDWSARAAALAAPRTHLRMGAKSAAVRARVVAKAEGIWCGQWLAPTIENLAGELGLGIRVKSRKADGDVLRKGDTVVEFSGSAEGILILERSYLNLASYLSGISTRTARFVALAKKHGGKNPPRITSTRKILPGYRDLAIHAVLSGGGHSHRVNLSGGVLLKENHLRAAGGIAKAVASARRVAPHGLKIEVEVTDLRELRSALSDRVEIVMLDNFEPKLLHQALKITSEADYPVLVEASGGITEATVADYAVPGVHVLSIGGLTHSVQAIDLSLLFD